MSRSGAAYRLVPGKKVVGASSLMQRLIYSNDELMISLTNSLAMREQEIAQRDSLYGKISALIFGRDHGTTIEIDGMRLKQLLELSGDRPSEQIDLNGFYTVRLEYFRTLLRMAEKQVVATAEKGV